MSVVVCARGQGVTHMACDSADDAGDQRFMVTDKIWQPLPWLAMGFVGSGAATSRIKYGLRNLVSGLYRPDPEDDAAAWVWENLSETMAQVAEVPEDDGYVTHVLVCVGPGIVIVEVDADNATPFEDARGYAAIGAGAGYSLGYLEAVQPTDRNLDSEVIQAYLRGSVEAAIEHCPSVAGEVRLFQVQH